MSDSVLGDLTIKLITVERLLILLLSDPRYLPIIQRAKSNLYDEYGVRLNELFPSDVEYQAISGLMTSMQEALSEAQRNIEATASEAIL